MAKQEKPKPKGGVREGAGRKPIGGVGTKLIGLRIRKDYFEVIRDNYPEMQRFIRDAIYEKLRRAGLVERESQD